MVTATGIAPGSEMTAQMEQVEERNVSGVLHVAAIFASHMVLQRNKPLRCSAHWLPIAPVWRLWRKYTTLTAP